MSKNKEMEKFEKLIKDYDCSHFSSLPKFIKQKVNALKKLQLEQLQIQQQYHKELHELDLKYEKLYQPLYEKRSKIITGEHEPTDEECKLPEPLDESSKQNGDQENKDEEIAVNFTEEEEKNLKTQVKGIPGFWLGCFLSTYNFNDSIEPHDKPVLRYLKDIQLKYGSKDDYVTYYLEFQFEDNPYFTNKVLTKTYYLKSRPDPKDPFSYEGFEVCKSEGCEINWNPGKNVTMKTKTVKQKNKTDGRTREKKKEVERDSFFFFFKPPEGLPESSEEIDEELAAIMAVDFELGEVIRQSIIPNAPLYYDGYMMEEDEDDEDDDDEFEDGDESDSDGADDYASSDGADEESNDSLNAILVKK